MQHRYKVRVHESGDRDGATRAGTIVLHIGGSSAMESSSIESAEASLQKQIASGKLARGCVYQICPAGIGPENPRAFAADLKGGFRACLLDSARGLYSEFRRIRYPSPQTAVTAAAELELAEQALLT